MTPRDVLPPWAVTLTDTEHTVIQYAVVVTALVLAAMLTRLWSARREVSDRYRPAVHAGVAVCTVALLSYVLLVVEIRAGYRYAGGSWVPTPEALGTWSARYIDWTVSVPLLVVEVVALSALTGRLAARARLVGATAAVAMVVLGFVGAVAIDGGGSFTALLWLGIASSVCFVVVYAVVIGTVAWSLPVLPPAARGPFRTAMLVLVVAWFVYPVVYGLQGVESGGGWTVAFHLLLCGADLVAKVVFGLLLLRVARLRTAADVVGGEDAHGESVWVDQLRQSDGVQPPLSNRPRSDLPDEGRP